MRRFLLHIFYFVLLLTAFYGILWGRYIYSMRYMSFAVPKTKTILAVGDSQMQAAIDDSLLFSVANVSLAHDNYWSMLRRIQLYIDANPQIDTVFLGITPHTVARYKDEFFYNYGYMGDVTKYYMPWLTLSDWAFLFAHDASDVMSALVTPVSFYWHPSQNYISEMGHFEAANYSHLQSDIDEGALRLIEKEEDIAKYGNKETLNSLRQILDWCAAHGIKVIGIDTPVYRATDYLNIDNYSRLMEGEFSDVERWEYIDMDIPDAWRRDVNHLNKDGARAFSTAIAHRVWDGNISTP